MASYCYTRDNPDGTKGCYVLEGGEYGIVLGKNSHDEWGRKNHNVSSTVWYDNTNPRQTEKDAQSALDNEGKSLGFPAKALAQDGKDAQYIAATNEFQESNDYMNRDTKILTRRDWGNTFPETVAGKKKEASATVVEAIKYAQGFDPATDSALGNVAGSSVYTEKMPDSGQDNGLTVSSLRGKDYYDIDYTYLLNQINWDNELDSIKKLLYTASSGMSESILGLPAIKCTDGDTGLKVNGACSWSSKPVLAATWNTELMYEVGAAVGQEALLGGMHGWYACATNIHRSPFAGRNFEYFSEDGLLSGMMNAYVVEGAGNNGLMCHVKHFALNDQETNRSVGLNTWATEQAMREIYFKSFEISIKRPMMNVKYTADTEGNIAYRTMRAANSVMCGQNNIGTTYCYLNEDLLRGVLRGEWGYTGFTITDLTFEKSAWKRDKALRAGNDAFMTMEFLANMGVQLYPTDTSSATARTLLRENVHHVMYAVANSSAMQGMAPGAIVYYDMSPQATDGIIFCRHFDRSVSETEKSYRFLGKLGMARRCSECHIILFHRCYFPRTLLPAIFSLPTVPCKGTERISRRLASRLKTSRVYTERLLL